jgi:hypothetical protein
MTSHLIDCPACSCLIGPDEHKCPFCAAPQRRADAGFLAVGLVIGLGLVGCGDKTDTTMGASTTTSSTGVTTDATDSASTTGGETTVEPDPDPSEGIGSAYATSPATSGDDDAEASVTASETGTGTDTDTGTGTDTDTSTGGMSTGTDTDSTTNDSSGTTFVGTSDAYAAPPPTSPTAPVDGEPQ